MPLANFIKVSAGNADIEILPQEDEWLFVFLLLLTAVAFAVAMVSAEISWLWWVPGLSLVCCAMLYRLVSRPVKVLFQPSSQTVSICYRFGGIFKKSRISAFDEIESVQSRFRVVGDNDPEVSLEMAMKTGDCFTLKTASPEWAPSAPLLGFSGCIEPKEIGVLRERISFLTGAKDLGFLRHPNT